MSNAAPHILITGAGGFVGRRLAALLHQRLPGAKLTLCGLESVDTPQGRVRALDIADADAVSALFAEARPTSVVHLAAVAAVTSSFADPRHTWLINTMGTLHVALAIAAHAPEAHLLFVSSAEIYGRSFLAGHPLTEDAQLLPANPYAAAKAAADIMIQEAAGRALFATIVRPFNHTGAGQSPAFVVPAFCQQIARIERGEQAPLIKVGELSDERDFLDVADVAEFYALILERGRGLPNGLVLNAASSEPRKIGDILDVLLALAKVPIRIEIDPARLRPTRVPRVVGDASRARAIGWAPRKRLEETLAETLEYWRSQP